MAGRAGAKAGRVHKLFLLRVVYGVVSPTHESHDNERNSWVINLF